MILRFIQRLVGNEYVSNVSLANFSHRFSVIEMYGKTLNISGEVPSGVLSASAFDAFKAITGGDRVNLERKGQQPFYGVVNAKLLFAGNMLPTFVKVDGTDSYVERLNPYEYNSPTYSSSGRNVQCHHRQTVFTSTGRPVIVKVFYQFSAYGART